MEKVYSTDGEMFKEYEDIMEELRDVGHNIGDRVEIEEGNASLASHAEFVTSYNWIDEFQERAYDNYGEWAEEYLDDLDQEKIKELEAIVTTWLNENAKAPTFYRVSDVKKIQVVIE